MRPTRTLLPCLLLAALAGCVEMEMEPTVGAHTADTGLAAHGHPLADGGAPGEAEVDPGRLRIELAISAAGSLKPGVDVELTVKGVAREQLDGGEVVLTLPTRALMDHDGKGDPELPAVASWVLPSMAEGGTWSGSHTVAGEAAGWYRVMANAYTRGPDGGPWLFDDVLASAWMHVAETGGRLTRVLEDSVAAGPAAGWPAPPLARDPDYPFWHPDTVYLHVVYSVSQHEGFQPAAYALAYASIWEVEGTGLRDWWSAYVREDGIAAFPCPPEGWAMGGYVDAPDTPRVEGRRAMRFWTATRDYCGDVLEIEVPAQDYYPWRLLNLAADTLSRHFGKWRGPVAWELHFDDGPSSYSRWSDLITLAWGLAETGIFRWVAAHEYGHALHEKALGGLFGKFSTPGCADHDPLLPSSYECALSEGFANYAGVVGSVTAEHPEGVLHDCFEYFGTPEAGWCADVSHDRKPEIEGWVAALLMDLADDNDNLEGVGDGYLNDKTHYPATYVAEVFRSCQARRGNFLDRWKKRSKVYDFVWCLEEAVDQPTHKRVFPNQSVPDTAKHEARQPEGWDPFHIRQTWLRNLAKEGR